MSSIVIKRGTTLKVKVTAHEVLKSGGRKITCDDGTTGEDILPIGNIIDLTGYIIEFVVWDSNDVLEDGVVPSMITKTIGNGIDMLDLASGVFFLSLSEDDTNMPIKAASYSCEFRFHKDEVVIKSTTIPLLVQTSGTS